MDRKQFLATLDNVNQASDITGLLKKMLKSGEEEIARRFSYSKRIDAGYQAARERAYLIDQMIHAIYDIAVERIFPLSNPTQGERLTIIALGGYGRGELAPYSDIDLLFVQGYRSNAWVEQVVEYILYRLWDLGLKPGYAIRTVKEALSWIKGDLIARTSLMEARLLTGDAEIFNQVIKESRGQFSAKSANLFVKEKLAERDARLARFGQSRYSLQPNIKEGKGGLRDLHLVRWLARSRGFYSMADMIDQGYLTKLEAEQFLRAEKIIWLYRFHLHDIARRAEESLSFDHQVEIAKRLALKAKPGLNPVERLMRLYFRNTRRVGRLLQSFLIRFLDTEQKTREIEKEGFLVSNAEIGMKIPSQFQKAPLDLLRIFTLAQKEQKRVKLSTLHQIQKDVHLIDQWRNDAEINDQFLTLIRSPHEPERWLHRLNETGILGRFLPDFGRIIDQVQFDMYHHYTVDEHTIRAMGELNTLLKGALDDENPILANLARKMNETRPKILFLAVLLHDIAKGRDRDHSEVGAEIALELGPRFGLSDQETETLSWLVRYHLLMSNTAFRRNLDDPKTIENFAIQVGDRERLALLTILTIADIKAVGPKTWTSWKGQLLSDLYLRTDLELSQDHEKELHDKQLDIIKDRLRQLMQEGNSLPKEAEEFIETLPKNYLLNFPENLIRDHYRRISALRQKGQEVIMEFSSDPDKAVTKATIICLDRKGLIAQLAGAFALSGVDIVNAQIFTLPPGIALDNFILQNRVGEAIPEYKFPDIEMKIRNVLRNPEDELSKLHQLPLYTNPAIASFPVVPRVRIHQDASDDFTVLDISGRDKRGLVHALASCLSHFGCSIASAKVATFGHRAVDVFYIVGSDGKKLNDPKMIQSLTSALMDILRDS